MGEKKKDFFSRNFVLRLKMEPRDWLWRYEAPWFWILIRIESEFFLYEKLWRSSIFARMKSGVVQARKRMYDMTLINAKDWKQLKRKFIRTEGMIDRYNWQVKILLDQVDFHWPRDYLIPASNDRQHEIVYESYYSSVINCTTTCANLVKQSYYYMNFSINF